MTRQAAQSRQRIAPKDERGVGHQFDWEVLEARRFDLLMLRVQLAVLRADPGFERLRDRVREIAALLAEKSSIPMVSEQMFLIDEIQTDPWWEDVTTAMLENARKRLRLLVKLIERARRQQVLPISKISSATRSWSSSKALAGRPSPRIRSSSST